MAGLGALDTPRTNLGDGTFLSRPPELDDFTDDVSIAAPPREANLMEQLRNGGGRPSLRTPRSKRPPFTDRRNLPAGLAGPEFTPLLKSATRRSARRLSGKENGAATPSMLGRIDEDMTPGRAMDNSVYVASREGSSFIGRTPVPQVDSDSTASTPMIMKTRRPAKGGALLQNENQMSLREQEKVVDRIEKENFGLKLKIHFLEDALRKAGPGFSEVALKENTELKVDKVTMQRELARYKKAISSAEKELESYRAQVMQMQDKAKKRHADEGLREEVEQLRLSLDEKEADFKDLQRKVDQEQTENDKVERLQDEIADLEADVREKDRLITTHEDKLEEMELRLKAAEDKAKAAQRRMVELEEKAQAASRLAEAHETIEGLESDVQRLENQLEEMKEKLQEAVEDKDRAEGDLEELQEELADKSLVTKGLSRQVEEKLARLQEECEETRRSYASLQERYEAREGEMEDLKLRLKESRQERDTADRDRRSLATRLEELQADFRSASDQKSLLQSRHDALTNESASLQRDVSRLSREVSSLEETLEQERQHALQLEINGRDQNKAEIARLKSEISHLQTELKERSDDLQRAARSGELAQDRLKNEIDNLKDEIADLHSKHRAREDLYDNDSEKWKMERRSLEAERDRAEERATGLQRTIEKLRETEGALSSKELRLKEALDSEMERHKRESVILTHQVEDLQRSLQTRQTTIEELRKELVVVRDELRQAQLDQQAELEKVESLEDEIEVLQTTMDEETERAKRMQEQAQRECDDVKQQLKALRDAVAVDSSRKSTMVSQEVLKRNTEHIERLKTQLSESAAKFTKVTKEKESLRDQLGSANIELHSVRVSLAETKAERDELEAELRQSKQHDQDTLRLDHERKDLRAAKSKLDNEVRRLREENRSLSTRLAEIEAELKLAKQNGQRNTALDKEKNDLMAAKTKLEIELRRLKEDNQLLEAERAEMEEGLRVATQSKGDSSQLEQERLALRLAKTKLDSEVRRLREENKVLSKQRLEMERRLEEEMDKAALEEERLADELLQLQAKVRQPSDNVELVAARRTIRDLERRIEDYEAQLANTAQLGNVLDDGNSDLSYLRRNVKDARHRERDYAEREAAHKRAVRDLKRQVAELERQVHEGEMSRLVASPAEHSALAARQNEVIELRGQLESAHSVGQDLKKALRAAERRAEQLREELQSRITELEDQAAQLAQQLGEAVAAADEAQAVRRAARSMDDGTLQRWKSKAMRYREERDRLAASMADAHEQSTQLSDVSSVERQSLHEMLRGSQIEADTLEQQNSEQRALIEKLSATQESLRKSLDRVRAERNEHRARAEQLQHDVDALDEARRVLENESDERQHLLDAAQNEAHELEQRVEQLQREVEQAHAAVTEAEATARAAETGAHAATRAAKNDATYESTVDSSEVAPSDRGDQAQGQDGADPDHDSAVDMVEAGDVVRKMEDMKLRYQRDMASLVTQIGLKQAQFERDANELLALQASWEDEFAAARRKAEESEEKKADVEAAREAARVAEAAVGAVVRQSDKLRDRRRRELVNLAAQIEWMQARFERESRFRAEAVQTKMFLEKRLAAANSINRADLASLESVLRKMGHAEEDLPARKLAEQRQQRASTPHRKLRRCLAVVRFAVRARRDAAAWAVHEQTRRRLQETVQRVRQAQRVHQLWDDWEGQVRAKIAADAHQGQLQPKQQQQQTPKKNRPQQQANHRLAPPPAGVADVTTLTIEFYGPVAFAA